MMKCRECGEEKPLDNFEKVSESGYRRKCKACVKEYRKQWANESKNHLRLKSQKWYAENKESVKARVSEWVKNNPEKRKRNALAYYYRLQDKCIQAYGGYRCNCCGETQAMFLALDHVENNGRQHRKEIGSTGGARLYKWIIENNFPKGFQVLCMNCNHGKYRNGGICPHQMEGVTTRRKP